MAAREDRFTGIDHNIAANLRIYREAGNISQEDLAQRMTDRGFGFSQATIWKIERGQRPVRASELVALADSLQVLSVMSLTCEPGTARHHAQLRQAHRRAHDAYETLKAAAAAYIEAQLELLIEARAAHDDGVAVTELDTSWLGVLAEEAVLEARIETDHQEVQSEHVTGEIGKVRAALRTAGYEPVLRIEDVEYSGEGAPLVWTSPHPTGT
jgi:transcriptional regulator with XRE-family HTH domain